MQSAICNNLKYASYVRLFTDGGARVGAAGYGFVILVPPFTEYHPDRIDDSDGRVLVRGGGYMGTTGTNNEAEAAGVLAGLEQCMRKGFLYVHHFTDSTVVQGIASTTMQAHTYAMEAFSRSMHSWCTGSLAMIMQPPAGAGHMCVCT